MTTVQSAAGEIVLPASVSQELNLKPGENFEIDIEDDDVITLRRVRKGPKRRLIDILLSCPEPFEIPPRSRELPRPPIDFDAE